MHVAHITSGSKAVDCSRTLFLPSSLLSAFLLLSSLLDFLPAFFLLAFFTCFLPSVVPSRFPPPFFPPPAPRGSNLSLDPVTPRLLTRRGVRMMFLAFPPSNRRPFRLSRSRSFLSPGFKRHIACLLFPSWHEAPFRTIHSFRARHRAPLCLGWRTWMADASIQYPHSSKDGHPDRFQIPSMRSPSQVKNRHAQSRDTQTPTYPIGGYARSYWRDHPEHGYVLRADGYGRVPYERPFLLSCLLYTSDAADE